MSILAAEHLSFSYGKAAILKNVSFTPEAGQLTALIGPNGCGKTTLLRLLAGLLKPASGTVTLDGAPLSALKRKCIAQHISLLPQHSPVPDITAELLVSHGRFPHLGLSRQLTAHDRAAVERAMETAGVTALRHRPLPALSGGERQRVYLAMLLAQDTEIVLLDEPTTHLDLRYKFEVLDLLSAMRDSGRTVAVVLHDLALALKYADRVVLMENGEIVSADTPTALFASGEIDRVLGVRLAQCTVDGEAAYIERAKTKKKEEISK